MTDNLRALAEWGGIAFWVIGGIAAWISLGRKRKK